MSKVFLFSVPKKYIEQFEQQAGLIYGLLSPIGEPVLLREIEYCDSLTAFADSMSDQLIDAGFNPATDFIAVTQGFMYAAALPFLARELNATPGAALNVIFWMGVPLLYKKLKITPNEVIEYCE